MKTNRFCRIVLLHAFILTACACSDVQPPQTLNVRTAAEKADDARQRNDDWQRDRASVLRQIKELMAKGQAVQAKRLLDANRAWGMDDLQPLIQPVTKAAFEERVRSLKKDPAMRLFVLEEYAKFAPSDAKIRGAIRATQSEIEAATARRKRQQGIRIGMSAADVLASSWGRPTSVNRTDYSFGTREQWVYGNSQYVYLEDGIVTAIQTSR